MRFVVYEESLGVMLALGPNGTSYWSKVDCLGMDRASIFDRNDGLRFILRHSPLTAAARSTLIPVKSPPDATTVPMATCVAAGLPAWDYMKRRHEILNNYSQIVTQ